MNSILAVLDKLRFCRNKAHLRYTCIFDEKSRNSNYVTRETNTSFVFLFTSWYFEKMKLYSHLLLQEALTCVKTQRRSITGLIQYQYLLKVNNRNTSIFFLIYTLFNVAKLKVNTKMIMLAMQNYECRLIYAKQIN